MSLGVEGAGEAAHDKPVLQLASHSLNDALLVSSGEVRLRSGVLWCGVWCCGVVCCQGAFVLCCVVLLGVLCCVVEWRGV